MSKTHDVLQNISYFLGHVIPHAHQETSWEEASLNSAIKWAEYCENVYNSSEGKPFADDLSTCIERLNLVPEVTVVIFPVKVNLLFLRQATRWLLWCLVNNPGLESQVRKMVISKYISKGLADELACDLHEISTLGICVQDLVKTVEETETEQEVKVTWNNLAVKIYSSQLENIVSLHTSDPLKMETSFEHLLRPLFHSIDGLKLCLQVIIELTNLVAKESTASLLCKNLSAKAELRKILCEIPVDLLSAASAQTEQIKTLYFEWLVQEGNDFVTDFDCKGVIFKKKQGSVNKTLAVNDLCNHFKALLKIPHLVPNVNMLFDKLSQDPGSFFWDELQLMLN